MSNWKQEGREVYRVVSEKIRGMWNEPSEFLEQSYPLRGLATLDEFGEDMWLEFMILQHIHTSDIEGVGSITTFRPSEMAAAIGVDIPIESINHAINELTGMVHADVETGLAVPLLNLVAVLDDENKDHRYFALCMGPGYHIAQSVAHGLGRTDDEHSA